MPQAVRVTIETDTKKYPQRRGASCNSTAAALRVPRHRSGSRFLVSKTLFTLWCRILHSYQRTAPGDDDAVPFVFNVSPGNAADAGVTALDVADNERWQCAFGGDTSEEAMIFHLYYALMDVDSSAWVIAFCIIDKLQLQHTIKEHMGRLSGSSTSMSFRFHVGNSWRNLFAAYCLALKWHIDYSVTLGYVVNLLPHASQESQYLQRASARAELQMLCTLDYNVFVYPQELLELLDHFLSPDERGRVIEVITRGTTEGHLLA